MEVPFIDLDIQYEEIKNEIKPVLENIYKKGDFILGEEVSQFEKEFADYCGVDYGVGVNSGTDSLFLALKAFDIGEGDEVIVPAFTYAASSLAISYTGAKPVFCDIKEDSYNINPELIEEEITDNTKAIMVVHLYGQAADMEPILEVADKHNLKIIEDCAQAHGCLYRGTQIGTNGKEQINTDKERKVGSFGDVGCFSFYPTKNLGSFGDGGMVITKDKEVRDKLRMLRNYGRKDKYHHVDIGYNSRLDTVQAAVLRVKLNYLKEWNDERKKNAKLYNKKLSSVQDVITPTEKEYSRHVYHVYALRIKNDGRDKAVEKLKDNGIGVIIHYPIPLHLQPVYEDLGYKKGDFPVSERIASEVLSLPVYPGIKEEQIDYVVKVIKQIVHSS